VRADVHVVADLDQVVELDAVVQHGVVQRAPVDAGVGANLHVVANAHGAQLLDLDPAPWLGAKPKPSAPMTTPLCTMPRAPTTQASPSVTRGASTGAIAHHAPAPMWHACR
jgi:hypothetical protein